MGQGGVLSLRRKLLEASGTEVYSIMIFDRFRVHLSLIKIYRIVEQRA